MQAWTEVSVSLRTCMGRSVVRWQQIQCSLEEHNATLAVIMLCAISCHRRWFSCDLGRRSAVDWGNSKVEFRCSWELFHPAADWA